MPDHVDINYKQVTLKDTLEYEDVTDKIIIELIDNGIFEDSGIEIIDEDDPEIYIRRLHNKWMEDK